MRAPVSRPRPPSAATVLPVGDHSQVGTLVLGGDLALGLALAGLEMLAAGQALALMALSAEHEPSRRSFSR